MNKRREGLTTVLSIVIIVTILTTWLTGTAQGGSLPRPLFQSSILIPSTISGTVFHDLNSNATQDPGEPVLPNIRIELREGIHLRDAAMTDSGGNYMFVRHVTGNYFVREANPAGYVSTTPDEVPTPITAGGQALTANFGDRAVGMIVGTVFDDLNVDGTRDAGEPGISGVTIDLLQGGSILHTVTTAGDGSYSFPQLWMDTYTVRETDPFGYASTTPNTFDVTLSVPGQYEIRNFGDHGVGTIQGVVFDDRNDNWTQDPGEPGISGVTIDLLQSSTIISTTTTDGSGWYSFPTLWLGDYTVEETDLPGYVSVSPSQANITLHTPGQIETENFADQAQASVIGVVFNDLNQDKVRDGGEPGISGVQVRLVGDTTRTTNTAGDGSYDFTGVPLGDYSVQETDPSGFSSTTSNTVPVALTVPAQIETVNFGDYGLPGEIQGTVFDDLNGNMTQDPGEQGLADVTIELLLGSTPLVSTTTDISGTYSFTDVTPGGYVVRETDPPGYASTTLNEVSVSLPPGGLATANFGDRGIGIVSGVVFDDVNGNGTQDSGESGISGVTVQLRQGGSTISTTLTNASGVYSFTGVIAGSYVVREIDPVGYVSTTSNDRPISVAPNGSATANFGDQQVSTISGVAFNDLDASGTQDGGESGLAGVEVELWQGTTFVTSTTTNGSGIYSFTGVEAGSYTVKAARPAGFVNTTASEKAVSVAPGGSAAANFGFQQTGTIGGIVFNDANGDMTKDASESGIDGVVITFTLSGGATFTTTTSGGGYLFSGVITPGNHTVSAAPVLGFVRTTPGSVLVPLAPGGSASANFGYQGQGTVGGVAFNDLNGNATQDPGESGIGGVAITMTLSTSGISTTLTAGDGSYSFSDVPEGSHTVASSIPAGFVRTGAGFKIVVVPPGGSASANFGFQGEGTVSGVAFNDTNGNGTQDPGESGIGGVAITMTLSTSGISTTLTAGDGSYIFSNVPEGSHTVASSIPAGFVRTTLESVLVFLTPGGSDNASFGFQGQGTVSGVAFNDTNGNGTQDPGESGIGSLSISLDGGLRTTLTVGDGSYIFSDVSEGSHTVGSDVPAGFARTTAGSVLVSVAPGGAASANFGFQGQGTVGGVAFNDVNGDGTQDPGESGIGGVVISLVGGGTISTTTLSDGSYSFSGVAEGSYTVESELPAGFVRTSPASVPIAIAPNGSASANFGFQGQGTVSGVAFNDVNGNQARDPGESGMGGVMVSLLSTGGTVIMATATAGDGSYSFSGVAEGNYAVTADVPAGYARTTPGSVAIWVAPGGSANANFGFQGQGTVSGVAFNDLNSDGIQGATEDGIGGVMITVTLSTGGMSTTVTAGDGSYSFDNLPEGSHTVESSIPAGFVRTTLGSVLLPLAPGGSASANFGFQGQGTVSGMAFNDLNGNGAQDPGENGINGVLITLKGRWTLTTTTSGDGNYSFAHVPQGAWTVESDVPAGFARTTAGLVPIAMTAGGSASADFGFRGQGTVSGEVFSDVNGNAIRDAGEIGIGGVVITLTDSVTTTTTGDGSYLFTDVPAGSYTVVAADISGFVRTTSGAVGISLAEGGSASANFGYQEMGVIAGVAFNDANANGVQDPGETGLSGVVITLTTSTETFTTTTDSGGSYAFTGLEVGIYNVSAAELAGFVRTTLGSVDVAVTAGGSTPVDFGYQQAGTIGGVAFNDGNGNGFRDPGESGIGGVLITYDSFTTTTSVGVGSYLFTGVPAGNHTVAAAAVAGFVRTTPDTVGVWLAEGGSAAVDFGYQQAGTIAGQAFNDANGNGTKDAGELGIGGVVITLTRSTETFTTTTAGDGSYLFTDITAGEYTVSAADVPGFTRTTPGSVAISVPAGGSGSASFGYRQEGTVSGIVFYDLNGDGIIQPSESGIGGVTVLLIGGGTTTATTASDGSYIFYGVPNGDYTVQEIDPPGFTSTTSNTVDITLSTAEPSASVNFGDLPISTVSGVVFNDLDEDGQQDLGEPGIGGVTIILKAMEGTVTTTVQTAGNGNYMFADVDPGEYSVQEVNPKGFFSTTPDRVDRTVPVGGSATANFGDKAGNRLFMPIVACNWPYYQVLLPITHRGYF
jgi:hypothetical protein